MQAVLLDKEGVGMGALDALRVGETAKPVAGPKQVVVKVSHAAINPVDWKMAQFNFLIKTLPVVLGCDVAGTVESVGAEVEHVKVGDRVYGYPDLGTQFGGFAEYTIIDSEFVAKIPAGLDNAAASTISVGALTAALAIFLGAGVPIPSAGGNAEKRTIIIWGAAGSVGAYAVQLAAAAGLNVVAVCSAKSAEKVKKLGAHATVDYNSPTVVDDIKAVLKGVKATIGFDAVSSETSALLAQALGHDCPAFLGCIAGNPDASSVPANVTVESINLGDAYFRPDKRAVIPSYFETINALAESGRLETGEIFDGGKGLAAVADALKAHRAGSAGSKKVVVHIA